MLGSQGCHVYVSREIGSINLQVGESEQDGVRRRKAVRDKIEAFSQVLEDGDLRSRLVYINPQHRVARHNFKMILQAFHKLLGSVKLYTSYTC